MSAPSREFELAVRAFSADIYRYAYWLTRHRGDAEDLVQECFYRAWRKWDSLRDENAVKQWLFAIVRNEFLRRFDKAQPELHDLDSQIEQPARHPGMDEVQALRQALTAAPLSLRDPLLLQVLGGLDCDEIAALQQTSPGAIATRLTRARKWFQDYLGGQIGNKESRS